jgi:hypothetical protein
MHLIDVNDLESNVDITVNVCIVRAGLLRLRWRLS